jgi:hypothetical protein
MTKRLNRTYVTITSSYGGSDTEVIYAGSDLDTAYNLEAFESNPDIDLDVFVRVEIWEDGVFLGKEYIKS